MRFTQRVRDIAAWFCYTIPKEHRAQPGTARNPGCSWRTRCLELGHRATGTNRPDSHTLSLDYSLLGKLSPARAVTAPAKSVCCTLARRYTTVLHHPAVLKLSRSFRLLTCCVLDAIVFVLPRNETIASRFGSLFTSLTHSHRPFPTRRLWKKRAPAKTDPDTPRPLLRPADKMSFPNSVAARVLSSRWDGTVRLIFVI